MVTSSTAAIRQSLERRLSVLKTQSTHLGNLTEEDLAELDIEDGVDEALEAISLDMDAEISELELIISVAKQAEFQYSDVKVETLIDTIDSLSGEDPGQKIIIFTEFVATQKYLQNILLNKDYTVTILNGSMSIDERNEALREFREKSSIFISTDAGGEGLNLQFSNVIINYDLPWNPMKIEQRCGRVDRIGQTRDVHIYNFIIADTVENRVRDVLEEKLSVILKEMGVDKYSDVLDSEVAECDFTEVYMNTIAKPYKMEENLKPIEAKMRQQLKNSKEYKEIIREEKDLTELVGQESDFEVESSLRLMLAYYNSWQGVESTLIDRIGITDAEITKHLKTDIIQDRFSPILSVGIKDFPNEAGYFMLWELSISDEEADKRILPVFVNEVYVLRPMAGKRIMEQFLDANSKLTIRTVANLPSEDYQKLEKMSMEFAYDTFVELREKQLQKNQESYNKYKYALQLRTEAAERIGIENIRKSRKVRLLKEREEIEKAYEKGKQVYPDFRLSLLVRLEA
jgi:hypothetical protein